MGVAVSDPCTALEERAAIIAEACGVSQAEGLRRAKEQAAKPIFRSWYQGPKPTDPVVLHGDWSGVSKPPTASDPTPSESLPRPDPSGSEWW